MEKQTTKTTEGNSEKKNWKSREIGALWRRTSNAGNNYLFGKLKVGNYEDEKSILVKIFKNNFKQQGSNEPDYRVYQEEDSPAPIKPVSKTPAPVKSLTNKQKEDMSEKDEEEVPAELL